VLKRSGVKAGPASARALAQAVMTSMPGLRELDINANEGTGDEAMAELIRAVAVAPCPFHLESLSVLKTGLGRSAREALKTAALRDGAWPRLSDLDVMDETK
jgi:hypothetical protein